MNISVKLLPDSSRLLVIAGKRAFNLTVDHFEKELYLLNCENRREVEKAIKDYLINCVFHVDV